VTTLWNSIRIPVAFLVAPLGAPITVLLLFVLGSLPDPAVILGPAFTMVIYMVGFSLIVAYPITLVLGVPLYRILRKHEMTEFWVAPGVGCGSALAIGLVVALLGGNPPAVFVLLSALCGAAVGAIFWLIARPDRDRNVASSSD
jgi:hypothetical protein